jgi:hypothetical protein
VADRVEEEADRLYGLPLEDFTRERDAAAKALRRDKEREAAAAVGALQKPSPAAWAMNAIAREQPELRDELLAAGDELRDAQEAALAGAGPGALRDATARQRRAIDAVVEAAGELRPGGRPLSPPMLDRLRRTLQAAAGDDEVRAAIAAGRLVRDAEGGGAWPFGGADQPVVAPPAKPRHRTAKAGERRRDTTEREAREEQARRAAELERRQEIEARLGEARAERRARERELARAERDAERAARRLEEAQAALDDARSHAEEAQAELDAARAAVDHARDEAARLEEQLD